MKRRIILAIGLMVVIGAASFITSDQTAHAQNRFRPVADTGVVTIGRGQTLRVTVAAGDVNGDDGVRVRFRQMEYIEQGNVYRIGSQTTSPPITLAPNEAAVGDADGDGVVDGADFLAVRTVVLSNDPNVQVNAIVFDTSTQRVVSMAIISDKASPKL